MKKREMEKLYDFSGLKKLSATELKFMELIWEHPEGISSEQIYADKRFHQTKGTKSTILYNISEKGYIRNIQQGRHHIYYSNVTKLEYEQAVIQQKLQKSFGNPSFVDLLAAFCGKNRLNEKQIERVDQLLEDIKNDIDHP